MGTPTASGERKKTDGARALRRHIDRLGVSVPDWCEEHGLDRIMVQRALNGERDRFSVDFAYAVEQATRGEVKMPMWRSATRRLGGGGCPKRRTVPRAPSSSRPQGFSGARSRASSPAA